MIKVSIVVPVYNVEKYLDKCLETLTNQTLEEIEIIVVNDGTKDKSQDIIDSFVEKYPQKVFSYIKENGGLSDARNFGLSYCRGEYIGFVDSDDYVELTMYEKMFNEALRTNADIVVCDYNKVYESRMERVYARRYTSRKDMFVGALAVAWNKIYKRSLIEITQTRFPKGLIYEDTEFYCKLIPYVEGCAYVNEALIYYTQRKGSIANTQGKRTMQMLDIWENIIKFYLQNGFDKEYRQELEYFCARVLLGSHMERLCGIVFARERNYYIKQTIDFLYSSFSNWKANKYLKARSFETHIYENNQSRNSVCNFNLLSSYIEGIVNSTFTNYNAFYFVLMCKITD